MQTPDELEAAFMGPVVAKVERAVLSVGEVDRVHVARWGEGIAHFHLWVMPAALRDGASRAGPDAVDGCAATHNPAVVAEAHEAIAARMAD